MRSENAGTFTVRTQLCQLSYALEATALQARDSYNLFLANVGRGCTYLYFIGTGVHDIALGSDVPVSELLRIDVESCNSVLALRHGNSLEPAKAMDRLWDIRLNMLHVDLNDFITVHAASIGDRQADMERGLRRDLEAAEVRRAVLERRIT